MIKRDEVANKMSCLNKAADDEPLFVLRAQDRTAPKVVGDWLRNAVAAGLDPGSVKAERTRALIAEMTAWQVAHPGRVKNPD